MSIVMEVIKLEEAGYMSAMEGMALSHKVSVKRAIEVAGTLYRKDGGHNKFLESIIVWMKIQAPRFWWAEADTYRVGMTKQSESTIHTITKRDLTQDDFSYPIPNKMLEDLNGLINLYRTSASHEVFGLIKNNLPEGFLQKRIMCTNYKTLRNMTQQRKGHKLVEWKEFIYQLQKQLKRVELIGLERIR